MSVSDPNENTEVNSTEILKKLNEAQQRIEQLESTNSRLLDENYQKNQKIKATKARVDEFEEMRKAKLTAEERLAEDQKEMEQLKQRLTQQQDHLFDLNVENTLRDVAPDARNLQAIMAMPSLRKNLEIDEENNSITRESAEKAVNALRESDSYLFGRDKVPTMGEGSKPSGQKGYRNATEKLSSMGMKKVSDDDLVGYLKENWKGLRGRK